MQAQIRALYIYPVKSCAGIRVESAQVTTRGLAHDRRFMIIDPAGMFITQREIPLLSQVYPSIRGSELQLRWGRRSVRLPLVPSLPASRKETRMVTVWSSRVRAHEPSLEASALLSRLAGRPLALVYMPDSTRRRVDTRYAGARDVVSFADGFPLLFASSSSLDDLNSRLTEPVTMSRFRPNVELEGLPPWAEDRIGALRFGCMQFALVKPCSRCVMVNVVPATGQLSTQPLRALAAFRASKNRVLFGQNSLVEGTGTLQVGALADEVVRSAKRAPRFRLRPPAPSS